MSGLFPTFVLPRDLRVLKERVQPQVTLIDALVTRVAPRTGVPGDAGTGVRGDIASSAALDPASRAAWEAFAAAWRDFAAGADDQNTGAQVDAGQELERNLRDLKSLLASQVFGVPTPARKRDVPFLPTWVTPNLVRDQKRRVAPLVRDLGSAAARATALPDAARAAWVQFARAWSSFESDPEEWSHCAAQYANALAFEDVLPEWTDTITMLAGGDRPGAPSVPGAGPGSLPGGVVPPGFSPPRDSVPKYLGPQGRGGASGGRPAGGSGTVVIVIAAGLAVGALALKGAKR